MVDNQAVASIALTPEERAYKLEKYAKQVEKVAAKKKASKKAVKKWEKTFEEENGKPPSQADKESMKPLYIEYKVHSDELETIKAKIAALGGSVNAVDD
jgi:predicted  nucleic acid-binding Zn-ribbon protein